MATLFPSWLNTQLHGKSVNTPDKFSSFMATLISQNNLTTFTSSGGSTSMLG